MLSPRITSSKAFSGFLSRRTDRVRRTLSLALLLAAGTLVSGCSMPGATAGGTPAGWKDYPEAGGNFTASFPASPTVMQESAMGMPTYIYEVEQSDRVYMVSYVDLPAEFSGSDSTANAGLEGAVSGSISTAGGTIQSKQDISIDGYPGKDVSASSSRGYMRVRYYLVGQRLYSVLAVSVGPGDASAER